MRNAGRQVPTDPWQASQSRAGEVWAAPSWWSPPHTIYIEPDYKKEVRLDKTIPSYSSPFFSTELLVKSRLSSWRGELQV